MFAGPGHFQCIYCTQNSEAAGLTTEMEYRLNFFASSSESRWFSLLYGFSEGATFTKAAPIKQKQKIYFNSIVHPNVTTQYTTPKKYILFFKIIGKFLKRILKNSVVIN